MISRDRYTAPFVYSISRYGDHILRRLSVVCSASAERDREDYYGVFLVQLLSILAIPAMMVDGLLYIQRRRATQGSEGRLRLSCRSATTSVGEAVILSGEEDLCRLGSAYFH